VDSVGVLIAFSIVGAVICAKSRVAAGAVVFALVGIVLFVSTPAGDGLPRGLAEFVTTLDDATTPALTRDEPRGGVG
jgi:hypothetical protein